MARRKGSRMVMRKNSKPKKSPVKAAKAITATPRTLLLELNAATGTNGLSVTVGDPAKTGLSLVDPSSADLFGLDKDKTKLNIDVNAPRQTRSSSASTTSSSVASSPLKSKKKRDSAEDGSGNKGPEPAKSESKSTSKGNHRVRSDYVAPLLAANNEKHGKNSRAKPDPKISGSDASQNVASGSGFASQSSHSSQLVPKKKVVRRRASQITYNKMAASVPESQQYTKQRSTVTVSDFKNSKVFPMLSGFTPDSDFLLKTSSSDEDRPGTPVARQTRPKIKGKKRSIRQSKPADDPRSNAENSDPEKRLVEDNVRDIVEELPNALQNVKLRCQIEEEDVDEYLSLRNSMKAPSISVSLDEKTALGFNLFEAHQESELKPGIYTTVKEHYGITFGLIRIEPRTVIPFEKAKKTSVFTVARGEVRVKTAAFKFSSDGNPVLISKIMPTYSQFAIPMGGMFSVENWKDEEAMLSINCY